MPSVSCLLSLVACFVMFYPVLCRTLLMENIESWNERGLLAGRIVLPLDFPTLSLLLNYLLTYWTTGHNTEISIQLPDLVVQRGIKLVTCEKEKERSLSRPVTFLPMGFPIIRFDELCVRSHLIKFHEIL